MKVYEEHNVKRRWPNGDTGKGERRMYEVTVEFSDKEKVSCMREGLIKARKALNEILKYLFLFTEKEVTRISIVLCD